LAAPECPKGKSEVDVTRQSELSCDTGDDFPCRFYTWFVRHERIQMVNQELCSGISLPVNHVAKSRDALSPAKPVSNYTLNRAVGSDFTEKRF
jgi:hypothetical protein